MPAQGIFAQPYGGDRTAGQIDGTTQIGSKNTLKYGVIYDYVVPFGNRYDFTSYTAFTTPPYIITYSITHPTPAAAAAVHVLRPLAEQQPLRASRPGARFLLASVLRAGALTRRLRIPERVVSRRRSLPVRGRRGDGRSAAIRDVLARYHRHESRAGRRWRACV